MRRINALELRHSLSKIIALLQKSGEPILLEKGRKPAAVIISLEDFQRRFVDKAAHEQRQRVLAEIVQNRRAAVDSTPAEVILREIRSGSRK